MRSATGVDSDQWGLTVDRPFIGGIVAAVAVLVGCGAFLLGPMLQSSDTAALARTDVHVERARRLLHQYSQNQERITALLEALTKAGLSPEINVAELLEEGERRDAVEEEDAHLRELLGPSGGSSLDQSFLQLVHGSQWQQHQELPRRRLGANVAELTRTLTAGLGERARLAEENRRLLEHARAAADQALTEVPSGSASAERIRALRTKGIVLYHLARTRAQDVDFLYAEADRFRTELTELGFLARRLADERQLVARSGIEQHVADSEKDIADANALLSETTASAAALQFDVDEIRGRIARATAAAEQSRGEMERLQEQGVSMTDPDGFARFSEEFNHHAQAYRQAITEAGALESGVLRNARIDGGDDLLRGAYVPAEAGKPIHLDRGLVGLEGELAQVKLDVAAAERACATANSLRTVLLADGQDLEERSQRAADGYERLQRRVAELCEGFARLTQEATDAAEQAAAHYRQAADAFVSAGSAVQSRVGEAGSAISMLDPATRERSPNAAITDDAWLQQQYETSAADSWIHLGRLYCTTSVEAARTAAVLEILPAGLLPEGMTSAAVLQERAEEDRQAGIEVLYEAYDRLQRTSGSRRGHWTVAAEAATAADMLVLLGEDELRTVAIAAYEQIVTGHEEADHVRPYISRLARLLGH
ncbi:MAG: hypothetical protein GY842_26445 [bacterium]|nr:hypothetical protein [bacterium]